MRKRPSAKYCTAISHITTASLAAGSENTTGKESQETVKQSRTAAKTGG
jgi:hypothetical protein